MVAAVQNHRYFPRPFAQHRLQAAHKAKVGLHIFNLPLIAQRLCKAFKITGWFVHVRLGHFDIQRTGGGIHHDVALCGRFADHLFVDLAFRWHINHHIAHHTGLTAQSPTFGQTPDGFIARFNRVPTGQRIAGHGKAVFGEFAVARCDLAFRTNAPPAANRIEIDTQLPRGG